MTIYSKITHALFVFNEECLFFILSVNVNALYFSALDSCESTSTTKYILLWINLPILSTRGRPMSQIVSLDLKGRPKLWLMNDLINLCDKAQIQGLTLTTFN